MTALVPARALTEAARRYKVVTQMGNQGHSSDDARLVNEYIQSGTLGEVREFKQAQKKAAKQAAGS